MIRIPSERRNIEEEFSELFEKCGENKNFIEESKPRFDVTSSFSAECRLNG